MTYKKQGEIMFKLIILKLIGLCLLGGFIFELNNSIINFELLSKIVFTYIIYKALIYSSIFVFKAEYRSVSRLNLFARK
jgi:hypothetical protein